MASIINASNSTGLTLTSDLSGVLQLQQNGSNTISFPSVTGTVITNKTAGTILQVVSQSFTPNTGSTTSSTPQTTGVSLAITPTSATSKVLCLVNGGWGYLNNVAGGLYYWLYRNGSNLALLNQTYSSVSTVITGNTSMSWVDSPATTSSTTYAVYFASRGTNAVVGYEGGTNVQMILMEIAA